MEHNTWWWGVTVTTNMEVYLSQQPIYQRKRKSKWKEKDGACSTEIALRGRQLTKMPRKTLTLSENRIELNPTRFRYTPLIKNQAFIAWSIIQLQDVFLANLQSSLQRNNEKGSSCTSESGFLCLVVFAGKFYSAKVIKAILLWNRGKYFSLSWLFLMMISRIILPFKS